jgi:hypothetical protein
MVICLRHADPEPAVVSTARATIGAAVRNVADGARLSRAWDYAFRPTLFPRGYRWRWRVIMAKKGKGQGRRWPQSA